MDFAYGIGLGLGVLGAPGIALGSLARRARLFHPVGAYFTAEVTSLGHPLGERLAGPALVRLSSGWQKGITDDRRDVLGLAIRFGPEPGPTPRAGDQDLLFGSFPSGGAIGAFVRKTNTRDLLDNTFWTASTLRDVALGQVVLRLTGKADRDADGEDGPARLADSAKRGEARLALAVRRTGGDWEPVADVVLTARVTHEDATSWFGPFTSRKGLVPDGLLGGMRRVAYAVSRAVRGV